MCGVSSRSIMLGACITYRLKNCDMINDSDYGSLLISCHLYLVLIVHNSSSSAFFLSRQIEKDTLPLSCQNQQIGSKSRGRYWALKSIRNWENVKSLGCVIYTGLGLRVKRNWEKCCSPWQCICVPLHRFIWWPSQVNLTTGDKLDDINASHILNLHWRSFNFILFLSILYYY